MESSLVLNGNHNGINCIQKTDAERSCDKIWFTEAQICEWSGMSHSTMYRRLKLLEEKGRICNCSDLNKCEIPTNNGGFKETTIYNLNVLNQLAMVCIESDVLNETAKKFSDILSEVETTGSYGMNQLSTEQQLLLKAFEATKDPIAFAAVIKERDEYIHKTELKRSMTSMGRLGGVTTALNAAMDALNTANETIKSITSEYDALRESIGQSEEWQSSAQLITNYPEIFGNFKSTSALTRYLKKRNVPHKRSDHPDKTGYLFTIFNVEEAMNVV